MDTVGSPEKADRLDQNLPHVQESVFLLKKLLLGRIFLVLLHRVKERHHRIFCFRGESEHGMCIFRVISKHRQRNVTGTAQGNQQPLLLLEVFWFPHEKEKRKRKKE